MCYNYETSRNTFILGTIGTILNMIKFKNNSTFLALNIVWYFGISMQLWEALIWKNYKCEFITKIAMINNVIQPLSLLIFFLIPNFKIKNKKIILLLSLIYISYISHYFKRNYGCIKDTFGINLSWWNHDNIGAKLHFFLMIILFRLILPPEISNSQIALFVGSFLVGNLLAKDKEKHIGSTWCWAAAFIPFFNYFIFSNLNK